MCTYGFHLVPETSITTSKFLLQTRFDVQAHIAPELGRGKSTDTGVHFRRLVKLQVDSGQPANVSIATCRELLDVFLGIECE